MLGRIGRHRIDIIKRAKLNQHHRITREQLSVREYMSQVLKQLQGRRFVEFHELFDTTRGQAVVVVTFIAMLELCRERLLEVTQAATALRALATLLEQHPSAIIWGRPKTP